MKRILSVLLVCIMIMGGTAMGDYATEEWYAEALKSSVMRPGNNVRLKNVIARAQAGEVITIGTMGGSITEGAGAAAYEDCWAYRFAARFAEAYGTGDNVEWVNAGVGGTPSTFGLMRFQRDINERVSENDPDGYPDLVVIEFAVNDWGEPSGHRCYESMVKQVLSYPNQPAVILLFSSRNDGWNIQADLRPIGDAYDLTMVSIPDGIYAHVGKELTVEDFFFDEYHPNSEGHRMMADCMMEAVAEAAARETDAADIDLDVAPVYGTDFMGLKTLYPKNPETDAVRVERGSFSSIDYNTYKNKPVGWVCGENYFHDYANGDAPLTVTGVFSKCLIAWKASSDTTYGAAEIIVDGESVMTLQGGAGKWNQSEVVLVLDEAEAAEHTIEIRTTEATKKFTITAISVVE